jgi:hypothetical protein
MLPVTKGLVAGKIAARKGSTCPRCSVVTRCHSGQFVTFLVGLLRLLKTLRKCIPFSLLRHGQFLHDVGRYIGATVERPQLHEIEPLWVMAESTKAVVLAIFGFAPDPNAAVMTPPVTVTDFT